MPGEVNLQATLNRQVFQAMPTPQKIFLLLHVLPTGEGVQVGSGGASVGRGVGVGSPTNIWPNEQPRLVASNRIIRAANRRRLTLRGA